MPIKDFATVKEMKVEMNDWEIVTSNDKTENFVSLWYKQIISKYL
jgi:hypothetical protein